MELDWWQRVQHPGSSISVVMTPAQACPAWMYSSCCWLQLPASPSHMVGYWKMAKISLLCMQHWSSRKGWDRMASLWGGYAVLGQQQRFWFAGDTGYCPVFPEVGRRLGPFDLAAIPIGAYEPRWFMRPQHINPQEAVRIHQVGAPPGAMQPCEGIFKGLAVCHVPGALQGVACACMSHRSQLSELCWIMSDMHRLQEVRSRLSIGIHCCTFSLTDEALDEPPRELRKHAAAAGLLPGSFVTLQHGTLLRTDSGDGCGSHVPVLG